MNIWQRKHLAPLPSSTFAADLRKCERLDTNVAIGFPRFARDKKKVTTASKSDLYRLLPSVDELLKSADLSDLLAREGQHAVTESVRAVLASVRDEINSGTLGNQQSVQLAVENLPQAVARHL